MKPTEDQQRAIVAQREREAVAVELAGLRRDAVRWNWAKHNPRKVCDIFDVEWMEERDFDAGIDAAMGGQHA